MYWNLKEKKKSVPNLWRAQNGHFFHILKNCKKRFFLPSPLLPWNLPMNFHQKVVFLHLESMPFKIKQRKRGVSGWKVGQTWHRNNCSHAKSTTKIYRHCLQSEFFSFLIWDRQLKFMFQHPTVWFDRKQLKYLSMRTAFVWFFAQEVDWCMINCDKQRLQTSVSINLWKILAGHTGDWFDVKTASICTTELWDALKSFILTSLKFKVAPYPIIVSLDTLMQRFRSESLRVRSWRSATFTPSAHVRRQSLPVSPPTLNKIPLPVLLPEQRVPSRGRHSPRRR